MNKGYQLIELALLDRLLATPSAATITVALLSWLVEAIRNELDGQLIAVELEVIRAEYLGPYPVIGVHYVNADAPDLGPLIEATATRLLQTKAVSEFVAFVPRSGRDWRKETDDLLTPKP